MVNSDTRERLKQIAEETIQRKGLRKLTFRDLAEQVGIKSSSAIYHFGNKDRLVSELVEDYGRELMKQLPSPEDVRNKEDAKEAITKLFDKFERTANDGRLCLCGMLGSEIENMEDDSAEKIKQFFRTMEDWGQKVMEAAGYDRKEAKHLSRIVLSTIEGALLLNHVQEGDQYIKSAKSFVQQLF